MIFYTVKNEEPKLKKHTLFFKLEKQFNGIQNKCEIVTANQNLKNMYFFITTTNESRVHARYVYSK